MQHSPPSPAERVLPGKFQAGLFFAKAGVFRLRRMVEDAGTRPPRHLAGRALQGLPRTAEVRMPLWTLTGEGEFPLTAGKVENLRRAAAALHGLEIPPRAVFSFWRQLGRTTRAKGYRTGRELREGCMIATVGGGLCQLSTAIYQVALEARMDVEERHAHSRVVPGSAAEAGTDATVFWNYVDLRIAAPFHWRLEVALTASELVVGIHSAVPPASKRREVREIASAILETRPAATGDCRSCGQIECFRHPGANAKRSPDLGHGTFLLDAKWPEFDRWCVAHARAGDRFLLPLDAVRFRKPNYAWTVPAGCSTRHATRTTLMRSLQQRSLPAQGALRQKTLLAADAALAKAYAKQISPECRHLVVSQNLLPHLWRLGSLGGRSFDVLIERWPLAELERRLDLASAAHPDSPTLTDFRADPNLVADEREALAAAGRLVTPHRAIAAHFGSRGWLVDWQVPDVAAGISTIRPLRVRPRLFFPGSPLGRKGIHALAAALREIPADLLVLGSACDGGADDPLRGVSWQPASVGDLPEVDAVILPAWIEHQPRLVLRALAMGIPVIATRACGLPDHPLLVTIEEATAAAVIHAIEIQCPVLRPAVASA